MNKQEDLISRQAAIKLAIDLDCESRGIIKESKCREIENRYNMIPAAQPQRETGHWIEIQAPDSDGGNALYECSVCHRGEVHVPIVEVPFCWHCGADMRGTE